MPTPLPEQFIQHTDPLGVSVPAVADTVVSEIEPNKLFGSHATLLVDGGSGPNQHYDTILLFDLSFMASGLSIDSIKLRLFVEEGSGDCGTLRTTQNTWWKDESTTWMNSPGANGIVIGKAYNVEAGDFFEMDVTRAIFWVWNMDTNGAKKQLSIRITSDDDNRCVFSSRDGDPLHAPNLWLTLNEAPAFAIEDTSETPPVDVEETVVLPRPANSRSQGEALLIFATDDATISEVSPDDNFGNNLSLIVSDDRTDTQDTLIQFDITELYKQNPRSAVLTLYVEEDCDSAGLFATTRYTDSGWNESDVTWSNAPESFGGTVIGTFGAVEGGQWFGFEVIGAFLWEVVQSQSTMTFRITSDNSKFCQYTSIEGGKAPKLMLQF